MAQLFLSGLFLCEATLGQQATPATPAGAAQSAESNRPHETSSSLALDVYVQAPDNANAEVTAAVMLFAPQEQLTRQGVTKQGHWLATEIAPGKYEIHVVAPGLARAVQEIDASGSGEIKISVQLQQQTAEDQSLPAISSDAEVNYIFGLYASRLDNWEQAKSYWTKVLELLPENVPAMVSMSEALLQESKALEAMEYLVRAEKIDPGYWRTQAALAEIALRAGSSGEAVIHAQRAMELGHEEAASVSPLLARALVARANEVLRTYVKDHPENLAAKKQLEFERLLGTSHVRTAKHEFQGTWLRNVLYQAGSAIGGYPMAASRR